MSEGQQIRFDDDIHPVISNSGGVYNLRDRSRTGTGSIRGQSLERKSFKEQDLESVTSGVEDRDIHKKQVSHSNQRLSSATADTLQVFTGWRLAWWAEPIP
jgi:hypothetical protein